MTNFGTESDDSDTQHGSWIQTFREVYNEDKYLARHWFWDNLDWSKRSIWIGHYVYSSRLPKTDEGISLFLENIIRNLDILDKSEIYIKFYFSRQSRTNDPEINYLMVCDRPTLPEKFSDTLVKSMFDQYQLTKEIIEQDPDFKRMLNHYIDWSNFYVYYNLMQEVQF